MNATATVAPAGPQYMRALERANKVRLARAELKRRVAIGELHVHTVLTARAVQREDCRDDLGVRQ